MTIDLTASRILRLEGSGRFVFFCDHASNYIPAQLHDLGLPAFQLARHIAWDIGASGVTARALYGSPRIAGLSSLAVHGALVAVILLLGAFQPVQSLVKQQITALEVDLRPYLPSKTRYPQAVVEVEHANFSMPGTSWAARGMSECCVRSASVWIKKQSRRSRNGDSSPD
jgi:hypothetical protein